jgi:carbonic anhydrase
MNAQTKESQNSLTPQMSIEILKEGNLRFQKNIKADRNLIKQVSETSTGQFPFATILSCIDSRVSSELIFDQGIGDIFSARIAGNFVNDDILGSMEFACKLAGTKLILVLGHTACGAVKGACDDAKLGKLTGMLEKIKPAVRAVKIPKDNTLRNSSNIDFVNNVAKKNVLLTIDTILRESDVLKEMHDLKELKIIGGMYDIKNGAVDFFE